MFAQMNVKRYFYYARKLFSKKNNQGSIKFSVSGKNLGA
jgi:hypothetical protein